MKETVTYRVEKGILLACITLIMVILLATPVMAPPPIVGQGGTVEDINFEIEGNQSALNIGGLIPGMTLGWDWRRADWLVPGDDTCYTPGSGCTTCNPDYNGFGVIADQNQSVDPWACYYTNYRSCSWDAGPGILIQDAHSKLSDDDYFSPAGKFYNPPEGWDISLGGVGAEQDDLTNVYLYPILPNTPIPIPNQDLGQACTAEPTMTYADGTWMVMAMERTKESGDFYLDFELNQIAWHPDYSHPVGKVLCEGCGPVRSPGDLVVSYEILGGKHENIEEDVRVLIMNYSPDYQPNLCHVTYQGANIVGVVPGGEPCPYLEGTNFVIYFKEAAGVLDPSYGYAIMNNFSIKEPPWTSLDSAGDPRDPIPAYMFMEAAINLSKFGFEVGCPGFGSVHAKSKSSDSATADLKDLAGPVPLPVECYIEGCKKVDVNADHEISSDPFYTMPPYTSGWPVTLYKWNESTDQWDQGPTVFTNASGCYEFDSIADGLYRIDEGHLAGWVQTFPTEGTGIECIGGDCHYVDIDVDIDHAKQTGYDFGNVPLKNISGCKFIDYGADGAIDVGDICDSEDDVNYPGCSGITVNLYNSTDDLIATTITGEDGCYEFTSLLPGDYRVDITEHPGFFCSYPVEDCEWNIPLGSEDVTDADFLDYSKVDISGCKEIDLNLDGEGDGCPTDPQDVNYDGCVGVTIELWNATAKIDETQTGTDGCYAFNDLMPGEDYTVKVVEPSGFFCSGDCEATFEDVQSDDVFDNVDFLDYSKVDISGCKEIDLNLDGEGDGCPTDPQDVNYDGCVGVTIELWNATAKIDETQTGTDGCYAFNDLMPGEDYTVKVVEPSGFFCSGDCEATFEDVQSDDVFDNVDFLDYQNATKIVCKYEDTGNDGFDTGDLSNPLSGWVVHVIGKNGMGESVSLTNTTVANGCAIFSVEPGTYNVTEDLQEGWTCTSPVDCQFTNEVFESGMTYVNNFTNFMPKNLYCGLTIGFWKENIDKYLCTWTDGRQVCDGFFASVSPSSVCDVPGDGANQLCNCGSEKSCANWSCIYDRLNQKSGAIDNAKAQITGILLTSKFYEGEFGFTIDLTQYKHCTDGDGDGCECTPNYATAKCPCTDTINDSCTIDGCSKTLFLACGEKTTCSVEDVWEYIVEQFQAGNYSIAGSTADCVNNYKFGCCDESYSKPDYFADDQCYDLNYCGNDDNPQFSGSNCDCAFCHKNKNQCYGVSSIIKPNAKNFISIGPVTELIYQLLP
jgi:hypothetical protein